MLSHLMLDINFLESSPSNTKLSLFKLQSNEETIFLQDFTDFSPLGSRYHPTEDPNIVHGEVPDKFEGLVEGSQSKFKISFRILPFAQ